MFSFTQLTVRRREDPHSMRILFACLFCVYVIMLVWMSTLCYSGQGWDCFMCGSSAVPVDYEGPAVDLYRYFLRARGRHPVCQLHTATGVGFQECYCHWLCWWFYTGELQLRSNWDAFALFLDSTVFHYGSHYFCISFTGWLSIEDINKDMRSARVCVCFIWLFLLRINISICCLFAIKAANSKLCFTWEWVSVPHGQHTHVLLVLYYYTDSVRWVCADVSVLVIMLNYVYNFATRYVSLIQIWRTEYTRTQLPGPPEEPVSPGQDRIQRGGNITDSRIRYVHGYCIYNNTDNAGGLTKQNFETSREAFVGKKDPIFKFNIKKHFYLIR